MMGSEKLIGNLVQDLKPVRPVKSPILHTSIIVLAVFLQIYLITSIIQESSESSTRTYSANFLVQALIIGLFGIIATLLALKSSIPGDLTIGRMLRILCFTSIVAFGFAFLSLNGQEPSGVVFSEPESACPLGILVYTILFCPWLIYTIKKGVCLSLRTSVFVSAVASSTFAVLTLHFLCPRISASHFFWYHILPAIVISTIAPLLYDLLVRGIMKR